MEKNIVFFNPHSGNGTGKEKSQIVKELIDGDVEFVDLTSCESLANVFDGVESDDNIIIAGGDGTLNKLINETKLCEKDNKIFYYACGSGNDFIRDLETNDKIVEINKYLKNLPTIIVNGKEYKFLNGVGYGIDGYCCEVGDKLRQTSNKPVNYGSIAVKGLLFCFKSRNATVTVDGKEYTFKHTWIAPTMNGRFYGGGMNCAPKQDRLNNDGNVSTVIMHGASRLLTLMIFPSIFKGEHINHKKQVSVLVGKNINVKFDIPCALQIDGETILNVSEYTIKA